VAGSTSATSKPGQGRPIEPSLRGWPGVLATCTVVSVWPKPSRIVTPQASRTRSITSGLRGSPAPTASRGGVRGCVRPAWIRIRAVAPWREEVDGNPQEPPLHGANTWDQACLAKPGEETLRCTSPGCSPIQYIVDRCPAGEEACVCSTSLGLLVVPEVKYSSRVASACVERLGSRSGEESIAPARAIEPSGAPPCSAPPTEMRW